MHDLKKRARAVLALLRKHEYGGAGRLDRFDSAGNPLLAPSNGWVLDVDMPEPAPGKKARTSKEVPPPWPPTIARVTKEQCVGILAWFVRTKRAQLYEGGLGLPSSHSNAVEGFVPHQLCERFVTPRGSEHHFRMALGRALSTVEAMEFLAFGLKEVELCLPSQLVRGGDCCSAHGDALRTLCGFLPWLVGCSNGDVSPPVEGVDQLNARLYGALAEWAKFNLLQFIVTSVPYAQGHGGLEIIQNLVKLWASGNVWG